MIGTLAITNIFLFTEWFVNPLDKPVVRNLYFVKEQTNETFAVSLWVCFYNLCRVHESIRCTPAMELGVTDHIWTIGELVAEALKGEKVSKPEPPKPINTIRFGYQPLKLRVIRGGRMIKPRK